MNIIKKETKGNWEYQLSERVISLANGTDYIEYQVSKLHRTKVSHYAESVKTYKNLTTAFKRYNLITE